MGVARLKMLTHQRDLKLERLIGLEIGAQIIGLIAMIIAARNGLGVYSLIVSTIISTGLDLPWFPCVIARPEIFPEISSHSISPKCSTMANGCCWPRFLGFS